MELITLLHMTSESVLISWVCLLGHFLWMFLSLFSISLIYFFLNVQFNLTSIGLRDSSPKNEHFVITY